METINFAHFHLGVLFKETLFEQLRRTEKINKIFLSLTEDNNIKVILPSIKHITVYSEMTLSLQNMEALENSM